MAEIRGDPQLRAALVAARTYVVLGAHPDPSKAAHYVPAYLHGRGLRVIPVNPGYAGRELWGEPVRGSLAEVGAAVDVLDVFRRPQALPGHLAEILALGPRMVWLQLGIRHDDVAARLMSAGIDVVQDRCLMVDHERLLGAEGGGRR